jgi:hypothetical protein
MMRLSLFASAPYVLQESITLCQSVQSIITLSHCSYETAKSVNLALPGQTAVLIDLSDRNLDRRVVLGLNDAVGCAALSWDVAMESRVSTSPRRLLHSFDNKSQFWLSHTDRRVLPYRSPFWRIFDVKISLWMGSVEIRRLAQSFVILDVAGTLCGRS